MTFSAAMYTLAVAVCMTLATMGAIEVRTGRVVWRPAIGRVTDPRAHGWMLIALAVSSGAMSVIPAFGGPAWVVLVVVVLALAGMTVASVAAFRAPPAAPGTPPVAGRPPADPGEVFRRPDDGA